jgi:hypothetical protein
MGVTFLLITLGIIGVVLTVIIILDKELFIRNLPAIYKKFDLSKDRIEFEYFLNNILSNPLKYNTAIINFDHYYIQYSFSEMDDNMILYLCESVSDHYLSPQVLDENAIAWDFLSNYAYNKPTKHFKNYHKDMAIAQNKEKTILIEEVYKIMEEVYLTVPSTVTVNYS